MIITFEGKDGLESTDIGQFFTLAGSGDLKITNFG